MAEASVQSSISRSRPLKYISKNQLSYLRSLNFTWTEISTILGVQFKEEPMIFNWSPIHKLQTITYERIAVPLIW